MPGVLVVGGVQPCFLEHLLTEHFDLPTWFWNQRSRCIYVRLAFRCANSSENVSDWLADRDFCVALVEVLGKIPPYHGVDVKLHPGPQPSVHAAWADSVILPLQFQHGCEVSLDDLSGSSSPELASHVHTAMSEFRDMTPAGSKRRRRLNTVVSLTGALARGRPASSVVVFADEDDLLSSPSSSSARRLLPTPDWLHSGINLDFACYLRLRSGLGLPTMSDFDALGILAKQLLSVVC